MAGVVEQQLGTGTDLTRSLRGMNQLDLALKEMVTNPKIHQLKGTLFFMPTKFSMVGVGGGVYKNVVSPKVR